MDQNINIKIEALTDAEPYKIANKIISILDDKKAADIKLLYVEKQTILADYFIICSGGSSTQIKALAGYVEENMKLCGLAPKNTDGYSGATWVVMDYGSVILHIFNRETRNFYNLEKLWKDASEIEISSINKS